MANPNGILHGLRTWTMREKSLLSHIFYSDISRHTMQRLFCQFPALLDHEFQPQHVYSHSSAQAQDGVDITSLALFASL
jgi:hypothetical protein